MKRIPFIILFLLLCCSSAFAATQSGEDGSLIALDNGTIFDSKTNLIWSQSDNGDDFSWIDAILFAESFTLASHDDWRLPTKEELSSLLQEKPNDSGLKISRLFHLESIFLYTTETKRCKASYADLTNGSFNWVVQSRSTFGRVLLVRNQKN